MKHNYINKITTLKQYTAFTLAEVLMTLTIIGVVAASVIPSLKNDIVEKELITKWKKDYVTVNGAFQRALVENGGNLSDLCSDSDHNCMRDLLGKYMINAKKCDGGDALGACWHADQQWNYHNGTPRDSGIVDKAGLILNDGALIYIVNFSGSCSYNVGKLITGYTECGEFVFDVNGFKKPNTIGKDIFGVHILKDRLIPFGAPESRHTCNSTGWGCTAEALLK